MSRRRGPPRGPRSDLERMVDALAQAMGFDLDLDDPDAIDAFLDMVGVDDEIDEDLGNLEAVARGGVVDNGRVLQLRRPAKGAVAWLPAGATDNTIAVDLANAAARVRARLDSETVPRLREIAQGMGWTLRGLKRDDILDQMAAHYADPDAAHAAVARLSDTDRTLVAVAAWVSFVSTRAGVSAAVARMAAHLPDLAPVATRVEPALFDLYRRGYLLAPPTQSGALFVAPAMYAGLFPITALTPAVGAPRGAAPATPPAPPAPPDLVGAFLGAVLRLWSLGPVAADPMLPPGVSPGVGSMDWPRLPASRERHGGKMAVRATGPLQPVQTIVPLGEPFAPRVRQALGRAVGEAAGAFYGCLGIALQIVAIQGGGSRPPRVEVDPERLMAWAALPATLQVNTLIGAWQSMHCLLWSEPSRLAEARVAWDVVRRADAWRVSPNTVTEHLMTARHAIMVWLRRLPAPAGAAGGWVDARVALRRLYEANPDIFTPSVGVLGWGFRDRAGLPLDPGTAATWEQVGWPLLSYMCHGPLAWLGLVACDLDRDGGLRALRLTPLGAAVLADAPPPVPGAIDARWSDDGSVAVMPSGAATPLMAALAAHGQLTAFKGDRMIWRLDAAKVQARVEAGDTPGDLLAPYARLGAAPPAKVSAWFDQVAARWGLINRYDDLAVITFDDAITAREVVERTSLGRAWVYQASDTCFVVEARLVGDLVAAMVALGHTPKVVEPERPAGRAKGRR